MRPFPMSCCSSRLEFSSTPRAAEGGRVLPAAPPGLLGCPGLGPKAAPSAGARDCSSDFSSQCPHLDHSAAPLLWPHRRGDVEHVLLSGWHLHGRVVLDWGQ